MNDILKEALKLISLPEYLQKLGMSEAAIEKYAPLISLILVAVVGGILALLWKLLVYVVKAIYTRYTHSKVAHKLRPQFDYASITKATKYYIPTQFQNASPAKQEEPLFSHQYIARNPLIP